MLEVCWKQFEACSGIVGEGAMVSGLQIVDQLPI